MLAGKMLEAIENAEKTKEMIRNAKSCVSYYFWEKVKGKLFKAYNI